MAWENRRQDYVTIYPKQCNDGYGDPEKIGNSDELVGSLVPTALNIVTEVERKTVDEK